MTPNNAPKDNVLAFPKKTNVPVEEIFTNTITHNVGVILPLDLENQAPVKVTSVEMFQQEFGLTDFSRYNEPEDKASVEYIAFKLIDKFIQQLLSHDQAVLEQKRLLGKDVELNFYALAVKAKTVEDMARCASRFKEHGIQLTSFICSNVYTTKEAMNLLVNEFKESNVIFLVNP